MPLQKYRRQQELVVQVVPVPLSVGTTTRLTQLAVYTHVNCLICLALPWSLIVEGRRSKTTALRVTAFMTPRTFFHRPTCPFTVVCHYCPTSQSLDIAYVAWCCKWLWMSMLMSIVHLYSAESYSISIRRRVCWVTVEEVSHSHKQTFQRQQHTRAWLTRRTAHTRFLSWRGTETLLKVTVT